jgi:hypothetical protein
MSTDKKISQLTSGAPAQAGDEYVVARSGANFKLTLTNIAANMPATTIPSGNLVVSTGNVGIGTASPSEKLQIGGNVFLNVGKYIANRSGSAAVTSASGLELQIDGSTQCGIYTPTSSAMALYTGGSERMRIDSSGNVSIGAGTLTTDKFTIRGTLPTSSNVSVGISSRGAVPSGSTTAAYVFESASSLVAESFTVGNFFHYHVSAPSLGAGSAITNQFGFRVASTLTNATNNYGFYSDIASGANRWNFYANGTAENYLANNLKIGGTAARATTAGTNQLVLFNGTAPVGTLANGVSFYSASGEANVMDAAGNATLLSPHDSETNEWIFRSKHTPTGKVLKIDVEKMLRFINEHFDLDMVHEFTE